MKFEVRKSFQMKNNSPAMLHLSVFAIMSEISTINGTVYLQQKPENLLSLRYLESHQLAS